MFISGADAIQQRDRQQILIELIELKFGGLSPNVSQAVRGIDDTERLRLLLHSVVTANSLEKMENLLNGKVGTV